MIGTMCSTAVVRMTARSSSSPHAAYVAALPEVFDALWLMLVTQAPSADERWEVWMEIEGAEPLPFAIAWHGTLVCVSRCLSGLHVVRGVDVVSEAPAHGRMEAALPGWVFPVSWLTEWVQMVL